MNEIRENTNCPHCLSPIEEHEEKVRCPECGVIHHLDCWVSENKCSVHGCEGWSIWNRKDNTKEKQNDTPPQRVPCIECGREIKPGRLMCSKCHRKQPKHYFDNCCGPSVMILGGIMGVITLVVKTLA